MKSLKTIIKDWDKLKSLMVKLDKEIQIIIESEERKTPNKIPEDFKASVLKALVELCNIKRDGFFRLIFYSTSAREIRDIIEAKKLYDLSTYDTKNIWTDIGFILAEFGFYEVKRSSSGNERKIYIGQLETLTGLSLSEGGPEEKKVTFKFPSKTE